MTLFIDTEKAAQILGFDTEKFRDAAGATEIPVASLLATIRDYRDSGGTCTNENVDLGKLNLDEQQ